MYNQCEVLVKTHQCTHSAIDGDGRPKCQYHTKRLLAGHQLDFIPLEQVSRYKLRTLLPDTGNKSGSDATSATTRQHTNTLQNQQIQNQHIQNQQIQNPPSIPTPTSAVAVQGDNNIVNTNGNQNGEVGEDDNMIVNCNRTLEVKS